MEEFAAALAELFSEPHRQGYAARAGAVPIVEEEQLSLMEEIVSAPKDTARPR